MVNWIIDCLNKYVWTERWSYIKLNDHASRQGRRGSGRAEGLDVNVLTESWAWGGECRQHSGGEGRIQQVINQRSKLRGCCVTRFTTKPCWQNVTCILIWRCCMRSHSHRLSFSMPTHTHTHTPGTQTHLQPELYKPRLHNALWMISVLMKRWNMSRA